MKIVRLAKLLENKYQLINTAGDKEDEQKINDVRQSIIDAFNNYVNPTTVKPAYNILPLLAEQGEKYSRQIISLMEDLVTEAKSMDLYDMFHNIQLVLTVIKNLQERNTKKLRESIDNAFPIQRETDRNRREMAKSKFENIVFKKLASILFKLSKSLNIMLGKSQEIKGGPSEPQVKEPTKQEQFMFRQSPLAVKHGLDNPDTFGKVWLYPDLRRRLIRLINKGRNPWIPLDQDPEVMAETAAIMAEYSRKQTNEPYFEAGEGVAKEMEHPKFVSPELKQERMDEAAEQVAQQQVEEQNQKSRLIERTQQRDKAMEEEKQRQIEEDRARLIKSEGQMSLLLARFAMRYL